MAKNTKRTAINIKLDRELYERFFATVKREAELYGYEKDSGAHKLRDLIREYCARVESVEQSSIGKQAASTLKKAVRS